MAAIFVAESATSVNGMVGDTLKLKCVKSDSFAPGFLASAVSSFYGKTEIQIIPKGSRSIRNIVLAKF